MAMTLSEMRTQVRANIRRDTSVLTDATLTQIINWTQERIADLHTFPEMHHSFTTSSVEDQLRYSWPARLKSIITLKLVDGTRSRRLAYVLAADVDTSRPYPEEYSGTSDYYFDFGPYFELHDVPDDAYTLFLRCATYPIDLTADAQESTLLRKDSVIVAGSTALAFLWQKEVEEAQTWDQVFQRLMAEKVSSKREHSDWEPVARPFSTAPSGNDYHRPFDSFIGS